MKFKRPMKSGELRTEIIYGSLWLPPRTSVNNADKSKCQLQVWGCHGTGCATADQSLHAGATVNGCTERFSTWNK